MLPSQSPHLDVPFQPGFPVHAEQFEAAERELSAFVLASGELYGPAIVPAALESWLELAEKMDIPCIHGRPAWRVVTIAAASRMASEQLLVRPTT